MEQPVHDLRAGSPTVAQTAPRRLIALGAVGLIHIGIIYAIAVGLASQFIEKLPEELNVAVEKQQVPPKTPPPPPPDLEKPPPPFVPPPDITIQTEAPVTNAITTQSKVNVPPPPKAPTISLTARGRTHTLPPYPEASIRLQEQGTTELRVTVDTDGNASEVTVISSSGSQRLDDAAVAYVKQHWKWNPPQENGQVLSVQTEVHIVWNLKNAR